MNNLCKPHFLGLFHSYCSETYLHLLMLFVPFLSSVFDVLLQFIEHLYWIYITFKNAKWAFIEFFQMVFCHFLIKMSAPIKKLTWTSINICILHIHYQFQLAFRLYFVKIDLFDYYVFFLQLLQSTMQNYIHVKCNIFSQQKIQRKLGNL